MKDRTPEEIDKMPRLRDLGDVEVSVQPFERGKPIGVLDYEGYLWVVGEAAPGQYYKELIYFD